jgi:predicted RNase H-like HicB family nuclease
MKTLIKLKIERLTEKNEEYFVATSDDLQGLVAQGKTIKEVIEIAEDVAKILLELEKETSNLTINQDIPNIIEYPLLMEV